MLKQRADVQKNWMPPAHAHAWRLRARHAHAEEEEGDVQSGGCLCVSPERRSVTVIRRWWRRARSWRWKRLTLGWSTSTWQSGCRPTVTGGQIHRRVRRDPPARHPCPVHCIEAEPHNDGEMAC